jgi:hypothetical protein
MKNSDDSSLHFRDGSHERYVAIRVDSLNWKTFILGGVIACVAALLPTVQIFDPSTVRSVVFAGGLCAIVGGVRLRRRFNACIDQKVQSIVAPHTKSVRRHESF